MKLLGWLVPWWAWAALAAVALSGAFSAGWTVRRWKDTAHEAQALKRAEIQFQARLRQQHQESQQYEQERETARQSGVDRQQAIRTVYRDRVVGPSCAAPDAVSRVLDDAVRDANARAGGQPGAAVPAPAAGTAPAD